MSQSHLSVPSLGTRLIGCTWDQLGHQTTLCVGYKAEDEIVHTPRADQMTLQHWKHISQKCPTCTTNWLRIATTPSPQGHVLSEPRYLLHSLMFFKKLIIIIIIITITWSNLSFYTYNYAHIKGTPLHFTTGKVTSTTPPPMPAVMVCPGFTGPTPSGVPVRMTSPTSRVKILLMKLMR